MARLAGSVLLLGCLSGCVEYAAATRKVKLASMPERACIVHSLAELQKFEKVGLFEYESLGPVSDLPDPKPLAGATAEEGRWPAQFQIAAPIPVLKARFHIDIQEVNDGAVLEMWHSVRTPAPREGFVAVVRQMRALENLVRNVCRIEAVSPSEEKCYMGEAKCPE